MFESSVLGIIQGIVEWLPVSSEGFITLAKIHIFKSGLALSDLVGYALFLHLGTFFAALIYFRRKVIALIKTIFNFKKQKKADKKTLVFLIISSAISGVLGFSILWGLGNLENELSLAGKGLTALIGVLLIITGIIQFLKPAGKSEKKAPDMLKTSDAVVAGIAQGLSILPGISRSGFTVSALLLRKIKETDALELSFLMSLPAVLGANIALNLEMFVFELENVAALMFSFGFGLLTIHLLLKAAKKLNFAWFALFFGGLTILAVFV